MGLHTNCVQVKHICVVLWTLTCELWMVQEPDELLCHGCSSFNSPNESQYPSFIFVKELNKHMNLFTSAVKLNLWTLSHIWIQLEVALQGSADVDGLSAAFLNQSLQLDWMNLFMSPLARVDLTWGPQFYPFTAQWDKYRLCRPWLEMLHFKLQYILIADCWKLMRNCFSGIIVPPISSYSLVRKYNFKALIVPSFFLFYQLSVFFSQSHFYFANYDGNQMEKCNLLRWKEAFVP